MKNKLRNTIIWLILIVLFSAIAYASVTIAKDRKSTKLPWQWTKYWFYDTAHNVWESYLAQDRFTVWIGTATGTVSDSVTWLMWQSSANTTEQTACKTYDTEINTASDTACRESTTVYGDDCNQCAAKAYCADLDLWWYTDWRLPNIKELQSIADYSRYNPAIDTSKFTSTANNYYWSSTPYSYNTSDAWIVYFYRANSPNSSKTDSYYVRCIR